MATAKKSTTSTTKKKTTTTTKKPVEETKVEEVITATDTPVVETIPEEAVVTETAIAKAEETPVLEEKKEEVTAVEEKPTPVKKTSSTKSNINKYAEEEKKYRKMAEEVGIVLPKYEYDENVQLVGGRLTGAEIIRQMIMGNIEIDNFDMNNLNPNSYNLTLDNTLKTYRPIYQTGAKNDHNMYLDMLKENPYEEITIPENGFALMPGKVYIASTKERTFTSKFQPDIDGRSSIGRLGIMVHLTAGYGDIGFDGKWTLEIAVIQPIIIYANVPICQISFFVPAGDTSIQYNGRYQHQTKAETSKLYLK